jgi:hypothetical protein
VHIRPVLDTRVNNRGNAKRPAAPQALEPAEPPDASDWCYGRIIAMRVIGTTSG